MGKTRRQDGGEEGQRRETIREVRAKMNIMKISNTRDVGRKRVWIRIGEDSQENREDRKTCPSIRAKMKTAKPRLARAK